MLTQCLKFESMNKIILNENSKLNFAKDWKTGSLWSWKCKKEEEKSKGTTFVQQIYLKFRNYQEIIAGFISGR